MIALNNVVKYEESIRLENVSTNIQNKSAQAVKGDGYNHHSKFNVKIIRNLSDDSFKVFIEDIVIANPATFHFVQINGEKSASSENSMNPSRRVIIENKKYFRIDSKQMGNIKFKDLKKIIIGYKRYKTIKVAYQINFSTNDEKPKAMVVSSDQVAEFKVVKEIDVSLKRNFYSKSRYLDSEKYNETNCLVKYSHAFYKPEHKDRYSPVQDLGSIYRYNDDGISLANINQDTFTKTHPKISTTSLVKSTLNDALYKIKENQPSLNISTEDGDIIADYSKSLFLNSRTTYDYKKQKTILGGTESPVLGEIIPYSFSGQYHWAQKISPFEILKDFKIDTYKMWSHAVLDESNGDIRMHINEDEDNGVAPTFILGESDISKIKNYNSLYDLRILMSMGEIDA
ncbi:MAG: hypothetical protein KAG14_02965 [Mycoplasmataceae bacterium]|nr:hypothetical protein [Mycoplasmataceae bacterium]